MIEEIKENKINRKDNHCLFMLFTKNNEKENQNDSITPTKTHYRISLLKIFAKASSL